MFATAHRKCSTADFSISILYNFSPFSFLTFHHNPFGQLVREKNQDSYDHFGSFLVQSVSEVREYTQCEMILYFFEYKPYLFFHFCRLKIWDAGVAYTQSIFAFESEIS